MMTHGFYDGSQPGLAVATQYDPSLVFLSIAIACLASYAALNIAGRIGASEKSRSQQVWILAGAWSMGIGIWAMHFIGMLALKLPLSVSYDLLTTVLSTIPAILAGAIMMSVAVKNRQRRRSLLLFAGAGTLVGAGIGSMHYAGMMAMHGIGRELIMRFAPLLFGLSIIIAVVLANVALYIFFLIGSREGRSEYLVDQDRCGLGYGLRYLGYALYRDGFYLFFLRRGQARRWSDGFKSNFASDMGLAHVGFDNLVSHCCYGHR